MSTLPAGAVARLLLATATPAAYDGNAAALDPATCHALVVGVLEWQDQRFSSFAKEERQDALLARTLVERGVPESQVSVLLDQEATLARIEAELERVAGEAGPGSTLLFYYAGHGTRAGEGFRFANYDMTGADDGLDVDRIGEVVAGRFEGERVLLFADCCHSGSLARVVERLEQEGIDAACVTSVVAENVSTGNWTFTQTLVEAWRGEAWLDGDADGAIEQAELEVAVREAMAARESQLASASSRGVEPGFALVPALPSPPVARFRSMAGSTPPAQRLGGHVRAAGDGAVGRLVGLAEDGRWLVRSYAYATHEDRPRAVEELEPLRFETREVGATVGVRLGPDLVAGTIVEVAAPFHRVVLPAWPEREGEWMFATRFVEPPAAFDPAKACMVEWRGAWYPALVLRRDGEGWWIHYVGYGTDWDEQVGPERIRFRPPAQEAGSIGEAPRDEAPPPR